MTDVDDSELVSVAGTRVLGSVPIQTRDDASFPIRLKRACVVGSKIHAAGSIVEMPVQAAKAAVLSGAGEPHVAFGRCFRGSLKGRLHRRCRSLLRHLRLSAIITGWSQGVSFAVAARLLPTMVRSSSPTVIRLTLPSVTGWSGQSRRAIRDLAGLAS